MSRYHAKYFGSKKVYEVIDGIVTINEMDAVSRADFNVMPDIQPYKSVVTGEVINSRSAHREMLKRNDLVEFGNERIAPKQIQDVPGRRDAIIEACKKHKVRGF